MPHTFPCDTLDSGHPGPHLLITAGVHGDEWVGMVACRRLLGIFATELRQGKVTIVPIANLAAFARANRCAEDDKDLARTFPGKADGTVTERLAHSLADLIRGADFYIDLHTCGMMGRIMGLAGYVLHSDPQVLNHQRRLARAFNLPVVWGTSPVLQGRSLSVARDANVPAIYAELSGGDSLDESAVREYVDGCLNVAGMLTMLERVPPLKQVRYIVEDKRDNSGHLQAMHRAPMAGFWEPAVRIGQPIRQGDLLGMILDPLGRQRREVLAEETGLVLFLRTIPAVTAGLTLGGILPISEPGERHYE
jgi:predicted deacylase